MIEPDKLWGMGTHEVAEVDSDTEVQRVPGGWLYTILRRDWNHDDKMVMTTTFVPYISKDAHARQGE